MTAVPTHYSKRSPGTCLATDNDLARAAWLNNAPTLRLSFERSAGPLRDTVTDTA